MALFVRLKFNQYCTSITSTPCLVYVYPVEEQSVDTFCSSVTPAQGGNPDGKHEPNVTVPIAIATSLSERL